MYVRYPLGCVALGLILCSCAGSYPNWEAEACTDESLALVDHAIAEAILVEPYVAAALAFRFEEGHPSYGDIVARLVEVRSGDRVLCAHPPEEMDGDNPAKAVAIDRSILINEGSSYWMKTLGDWAEGQEYGEFTTAELEATVPELEGSDYARLMEQASAYLVGPAGAVELLVHEAAHFEAADCCHHESGDSHDCDFVDSVGKLAAHGVYWERWVDEGQWLDQLYWGTPTD